MKDFYKAKHVRYTNMFGNVFNLNKIQSVCYDKRFVAMFCIENNENLIPNKSFKINQSMWIRFRLEMMNNILEKLKEL